MHRPQAVLCDVVLLLFLLFAAKISATEILLSAEIFGPSTVFGAENSQRARCSFAVFRCLLHLKHCESPVREK